MPNPIETTRKALVDTIRQHAERQGITQGEIASRSGLQRTNVNRVLSGRYPPTIDVLLKIVDAVGAELIVKSCNSPQNVL
jgi:transcriptional regulator with XRE-family HTH domain